MKGEERKSRSFWVPVITFFNVERHKGAQRGTKSVAILIWGWKRMERRHDASRSARLHAAADMKVRITRARWVLYLAAKQNTRGGGWDEVWWVEEKVLSQTLMMGDSWLNYLAEKTILRLKN